MKHNFLLEPTGDAANRFCYWLEQETIDSLRRTHGNNEATKSAVFLFVNRAYEARMSAAMIGEMFGTCIVRAGHSEHDEELDFRLLEEFGQLAAKVHGAE